MEGCGDLLIVVLFFVLVVDGFDEVFGGCVFVVSSKCGLLVVEGVFW